MWNFDMNNTLANGFMILEHLASEAEACSVKELATHFGLPNSHVCRLLKTLVKTGHVEQLPENRKYRISLKVLTLSNARLAKLTLRNLARPFMQKLVREVKRPIYMTAYYDGRSLIVATEYPERFSDDGGWDIGHIQSVNRSACGKVCAAHAPAERLEELITECDWSARTGNSVVDPAAFRRELADVRRRGMARVAGEFCPTLGAVAAPVFDADEKIYGALGMLVPPDETLWTPAMWEHYGGIIRRHATSVSFALGFPGEPRATLPGKKDRLAAGRSVLCYSP